MKFITGICLFLLALLIAAAVLTGHAQDASPTPEITIVTNTPAAVATPEATLAVAPIVPTEAPPVVVEVQPIPTAPPDNSFTLKDILVAVVLIAAIAGLTVVFREFIIQLGKSAPQWAYQAGLATETSVEKAVGDYVRATPNTFDDAIFDAFQKQLNAMKEEITKLRSDKPAA